LVKIDPCDAFGQVKTSEKVFMGVVRLNHLARQHLVV